VAFFDWLGDSNLTQIKRSLPPLPCQAGCAYCCYVGPERPDLLAPELLRIVDYLSQERSAALLAEVQSRLRDPHYAAQAEKPPCLFLSQEHCTIYPVRPMRCRAQHSPDRAACRSHYLGQQATMPLLREPALLYKSLQIGLRLGLREVKLQNKRLALDGALRLALLEQPDALEQWVAGKTVWDAVALPEEADEGQLLDQFQGRARGEMHAEARRLIQVITTLVEQPGAWALYPSTGKSPSPDLEDTK